MRLRAFPFATSILMVFAACRADAEPSAYRSVSFATSDGGAVHASLFEGGPLAVVMAHGAVFDKESWYPLAMELQAAGVTALPIDFRGTGSSAAPSGSRDKHLDITAAVGFLRQEGHSRIGLLGASMGGGATLRALGEMEEGAVRRVCILASGRGEPIASTSTEKLFIISEGDGLRASFEQTYHLSADPKRLRVVPGKAHAQHIFDSEQGGELTRIILEFFGANRR